MTNKPEGSAGELPPVISTALDELVSTARDVLGDSLSAIVLFGSAAEGRLRNTSDVNVIFVLTRFEPQRAAGLRAPFRTAHAIADLSAMFLLTSEISAAVSAFAEKFADVLRRRRVLYGADPFAGVTIPREAELARLRQVLLNSLLRMRAAFIARGLREEQLAHVLADSAGPLRSDAAAILELEGRPAASPKEALAKLAAELAQPNDPEWPRVLENVSVARERMVLPSGIAAEALLAMMTLADRMRARVESIEGRSS